MSVLVQGSQLKNMINQIKMINELTFIAEKGDDEMRYAVPRIRGELKKITAEFEQILYDKETT